MFVPTFFVSFLSFFEVPSPRPSVLINNQLNWLLQCTNVNSFSHSFVTRCCRSPFPNSVPGSTTNGDYAVRALSLVEGAGRGAGKTAGNGVLISPVPVCVQIRVGLVREAQIRVTLGNLSSNVHQPSANLHFYGVLFDRAFS